MAKKVADGGEAASEKPVKPTQRLCNEIQLFDLCEGEKCGHKQGLYCNNTELLDRFEAIAEEEERSPAAQGCISDEQEDDAETSDDEYDDTCDDDQFGDEGFEEDEVDK